MNSSSLQDIVACLAYPVADTPHQYVMERAIASARLDCRYLTLEVAPEDLAASLRGAQASGVLGVSVAPMHEKAAGELSEGLVGDAQWTRHVDLITWRDKVAISKYTWGDAAEAALEAVGELQNISVVVWGEGAAAQATAASLARNGYEQVTLITKTPQARDQVAAQLAQSGSQVEVRSAEDAPRLNDNLGVIVLADEPGLDRDALPPYELDDIHPETAVVELFRHETPPEILEQAYLRASPFADSLDVLVHRLAIAFRDWTGKEPDLREMRESLEEFWNV